MPGGGSRARRRRSVLVRNKTFFKVHPQANGDFLEAGKRNLIGKGKEYIERRTQAELEILTCIHAANRNRGKGEQLVETMKATLEVDGGSAGTQGGAAVGAGHPDWLLHFQAGDRRVRQ